jgi:hypothetical protein
MREDSRLLYVTQQHYLNAILDDLRESCCTIQTKIWFHDMESSYFFDRQAQVADN